LTAMTGPIATVPATTVTTRANGPTTSVGHFSRHRFQTEDSTRVETFGDNQGNGNNDARWVKRVSRDRRSREVFSYHAVNGPANRTAVPAP
jgi:hypothetical protein